MNYSTAVFLINKNVRAVMGTYEDAPNAGKTMFKTLDPTIKVNDFVVVPTDTRHKMTVFKVTDVDVSPDFDSATQIAWVIGKVDRVAHEQVLVQEAAAIETIKSAELRKRRENLRDALLNDAEGLKALPIYANGK